ncbi:helix-turn-helix transcriptional regulator [Pedobacter sp. SYP-B3415]|uniref:helix-turn-helix transcriptional regulator n=1 Tax=Pedobacter sp. SYP-B3415 TaxID=2496641 RepID=UPI00101C74A1|nr:helix-turn-helix transcriptional regulator [Pedobacter sp. SYP-B3415]
MYQQVRYPPPPELQDCVRYFWSLDFDHPDRARLQIQLFADRFPRLIFQNMGMQSKVRDAFNNHLPVSFLSGLTTAPAVYEVSNSYAQLGVSFYPQALQQVFGLNASEISDQLIDLNHFCTPELNERLTHAAGTAEQLEILSSFLIRKLRSNTRKDQLITSVLKTQHSSLNPQVRDLTSSLHVSQRQLERRFKDSVGIGLKVYLRILRFEHALQLMNGKEFSNFSKIAHRLGYTDQSHFIREFKQFAGYTPHRFFVRQKIGSESSGFLLPCE